MFLTNPRQAVNTAAEIGRLNGNHYAYLRHNLNHARALRKALLIAPRSGVSELLR
jgi:hypothetical protein